MTSPTHIPSTRILDVRAARLTAEEFGREYVRDNDDAGAVFILAWFGCRIAGIDPAELHKAVMNDLAYKTYSVDAA